MAEYRVVCVKEQPAGEFPGHGHLRGIGTGTVLGEPAAWWDLEAVVASLRDKTDQFFLLDDSTGERSMLEEARCLRCSEPGVQAVNGRGPGLDSLPRCPSVIGLVTPFSSPLDPHNAL